MNKDLGLSSYIFGLGAGAFVFWGYFLLEVPSNLILDRVGARRWIARIMVSSGPSFRCVCVHQRAGQFFHPAFSAWPCRSRVLSGNDPLLHLLVPAVAPLPASSPASWRRSRCRSDWARQFPPPFLELDGVLGVAGWRWLFICEAAPAVIFGIATFYLTDRPPQADWLEAEERDWLAKEMEKERKTVETGRTISVLQTLFNPRVRALRLMIGDVADHQPRRKWPAHRSVHKDPAWGTECECLAAETIARSRKGPGS